jgi:hypothetical protein
MVSSTLLISTWIVSPSTILVTRAGSLEYSAGKLAID